jgi:hypothetical protein
MSHLLINRSPDLKRLRDEGFEIEIRSGFLLVHNVPYVNSTREIRFGTLATELTLAGQRTARPSTHVALFAGEYPCRQDGFKITQIEHQSLNTNLGGGLIAKFSFSNKPEDGYRDYYHKMTRYIDILSHPARSIDSGVMAQNFKVITVTAEESVFKYLDTASSRCGIIGVSEKLKGWRIGIVGLGGTGSYVLDLMAKTPVNEIHLFDGDFFLQHNAFRAPGAPTIEELDKHQLKVDYFAKLYSNMRANIFPHGAFINETNVDSLREMDFVFLCIDGGASKRLIIETLESARKSFIDVGMGIELIEERASLNGVLRVTSSTEDKRDHIRGKNRISFTELSGHNDYDQNIQVADLNSLNAALAVIKWKKLCGFYIDQKGECHSTYSINDNLLTSSDLMHEKQNIAA